MGRLRTEIFKPVDKRDCFKVSNCKSVNVTVTINTNNDAYEQIRKFFGDPYEGDPDIEYVDALLGL